MAMEESKDHTKTYRPNLLRSARETFKTCKSKWDNIPNIQTLCQSRLTRPRSDSVAFDSCPKVALADELQHQAKTQ
jgi:hypothetical protein